LLDMRACGSVGGQQVMTTSAAGKIANDDVRFPNQNTCVINHGHHPYGIQRPKFRFRCRTKCTAPIFALVLKAQFFTSPQDFADVDRCGVSVDLQHEGKLTGEKAVCERQASRCSTDTLLDRQRPAASVGVASLRLLRGCRQRLGTADLTMSGLHSYASRRPASRTPGVPSGRGPWTSLPPQACIPPFRGGSLRVPPACRGFSDESPPPSDA
jgi:hypothetical protein